MRMSYVLLICVTAMLALGAVAWAEDEITDDFTSEVPGRWRAGKGDAWTIADGECSKEPASGEYGQGLFICDFPMTEGEVETVIRPMYARRSSSVGIVGKFITGSRCWYVRIAYGAASLITKGTEMQGFKIGPINVKDGQPRKLRLVFREGRAGFYVDDVLRTIFRDPLAGEAGSPGLYTESASVATSFSARRIK